MGKIKDIEKFLNEIEGRKDLLVMLSLERLKILEDYYDNDIKRKKEKIIKLKQQLQLFI